MINYLFCFIFNDCIFPSLCTTFGCKNYANFQCKCVPLYSTILFHLEMLQPEMSWERSSREEQLQQQSRVMFNL